MQEFPEEKGDYIDLDSQDHILIETTNSEETINDVDAVPKEFEEASNRNIVTGKMELTPISESESPADENSSTEIGGETLSSIDTSKDSTDTNSQKSDSDNANSDNTNSEGTNSEDKDKNSDEEKSNDDDKEKNSEVTSQN